MSDHLAKEAERLLKDDTLNTALDAMRKDALEALAVENAHDVTAILRHQARVESVDAFRAVLNAAILRQAKPREGASPFP